MTNRGYDSYSPDYTLTDWRGEVIGACKFIAFIAWPYALTFTLAWAWIGLGNDMLPELAPDAVPYEVAKFAEEIWIIGMGLGLICAALWDEWNTPR